MDFIQRGEVCYPVGIQTQLKETPELGTNKSIGEAGPGWQGVFVEGEGGGARQENNLKGQAKGPATVLDKNDRSHDSQVLQEFIPMMRLDSMGATDGPPSLRHAQENVKNKAGRPK